MSSWLLFPTVPPSGARVPLRDYSSKNGFQRWGEKWHIPVWDMQQIHFHADLLFFCCSVVSDSLHSHGLQHARLPCLSPSSGACSNSCPSSQWGHPTISSSVIPFSSRLQSFPASGSKESAPRIRWPKYWSFNLSIMLIISPKSQKADPCQIRQWNLWWVCKS